MGNFDHKVHVSVNKQKFKLVRTYPFVVIVLCFTTLLLKCNGDESSSLYVPRNKDNFKSSSALSLNENVAFQNEAHTKLKNKRFKRNPLPEPIAEVLGSSSINSGSNFRISQEQVQNSHKPIFERCDEYRPSVEEESARGKINISYLEVHIKMVAL